MIKDVEWFSDILYTLANSHSFPDEWAPMQRYDSGGPSWEYTYDRRCNGAPVEAAVQRISYRWTPRWRCSATHRSNNIHNDWILIQNQQSSILHARLINSGTINQPKWEIFYMLLKEAPHCWSETALQRWYSFLWRINWKLMTNIHQRIL